MVKSLSHFFLKSKRPIFGTFSLAWNLLEFYARSSSSYTRQSQERWNSVKRVISCSHSSAHLISEGPNARNVDVLFAIVIALDADNGNRCAAVFLGNVTISKMFFFDSNEITTFLTVVTWLNSVGTLVAWTNNPRYLRTDVQTRLGLRVGERESYK